MGAVIKYAEYIMGVVFKLRMTTCIPSSSSQREGSKGAMRLKFSKRDLIPLTYPKEKIGVLTTSNSDLLQFVYRICSHSTPRISYTPSIGSQRESTKSAIKFKSFQKVYNCPHFTREFREHLSNRKSYNLQIVRGYFSR